MSCSKVSTKAAVSSDYSDKTCNAKVPSDSAADSLLNQCDSIDAAKSIGNSILANIALAETLCTGSRFLEADTLLKAALSTIDSASESDIENFSPDQFIDSILKVYTVMMPPEFLPDDIAMIQFNRQMERSLDSIICSSDDSALISILTNRKDIQFDVPMVWNESVIKALSYYLHSKPGTISRWLERAAYYLPVMKKMFADSGLPQDLAYLPLIESGFNTQAYSHAKAAGIWQFISATGKRYGLRHNYWLDERRDPLKSTASAIAYLKKLYGDFGNWHLALAAYNCGEGGVSRAIEKSGTANYWQLSLPKETKNYVPCYLAALTIAKNPDLFNISYDTLKSFAFDTVLVSDCIDMRDIADAVSSDYDGFKKSNPHITHWCTPPDNTNVRLYLPPGTSDKFKEYVTSIPDEKKVRWYVYKIRRGDNIQSISRRFKVSADAVREINRLNKSSRIIAGKVLYIPIPAKSDISQYALEEEEKTASGSTSSSSARSGKSIKYKVRQGDTVSKIAILFDVSEKDINEWNHLSHSVIKTDQILRIYSDKSEEEVENVSVASSDIEKYTVQSGDSPYSISKKFDITIDEIISLNHLDKNNPVIKTGQTLSLKKQSSGTAPGSRKRTESTDDFIQYAVSPGDNLYRIAQNFSIPLEELMKTNNMTENDKIHVGDMIRVPRSESSRSHKAPVVSAGIVYYQVKQGDNLWNIAESFGIPVQNLFRINDLNKDSVLMPGDTIKVVKSGEM